MALLLIVHQLPPPYFWNKPIWVIWLFTYYRERVGRVVLPELQTHSKCNKGQRLKRIKPLYIL